MWYMWGKDKIYQKQATHTYLKIFAKKGKLGGRGQVVAYLGERTF